MAYRASHAGFTLLELVVVVAIVGVFLAVALVAINGSKNRGIDSGITKNLLSARTQAEIYFTGLASYNGVCNDSSTGIYRQMQAAKRAYGGVVKATYDDGTASTWNTEQCNDSPTAYAAWVPISSTGLGAPRGWCVDSRKVATTSTAVLGAGATQCP